ncbi:MAG: phosphotransferase, partial [Pseudomonadales bacterium]|nr:phosphotransferase [Pseudomonadales bacterium]
LFEEWFCGKLLQMDLAEEERQLITDTLRFLEDCALAQETVVVHRDYHSRNLMLLPQENSPGIIDFQDAVRGPYTYDLVSLLRDCYICWPSEQVDSWAGYYFEKAQETGIVASISPEQFRRDLDLMGLQRNLKVMGIFSRLAIRDNKSRYLADIPLVIHYFTEISSRHSEMSAFRDWFLRAIVPLAQERLPHN